MQASQLSSAGELRTIARALGMSLAGLRTYGEPDSDPEKSLAALDPRSPQLLLAAARAANRSGNLALAERHLRLALDLLPEYAEASLRLAQIHRRNRDLTSAAYALLAALASPLCFGGLVVHMECLQNLHRMRDVEMPADVLSDPLWQMRHQLNLQIGKRRNDDLAVWEEAIAAYHDSGQGVLAVRLRMLLGELLSFEPVSLQERYGWTHEKQREDLRNDLVRANLHARLVTIG